MACRIMLKLAQEGGLFGGRVPEVLLGPPWAFHAGDVAAIHSDESHDLHITALKIQEKFGLEPHTLPYGARRNVKYICKMVRSPRRLCTVPCCMGSCSDLKTAAFLPFISPSFLFHSCQIITARGIVL